MAGEASLSELKVNLWMPLDIGPFLQDTAHLSAEEIGAYTLLLIYYWAHGPLPNDAKRLANITKMTADTWSITHEALSMYFSVGPDGLLHQKGADRRRAQWLDKRLKAREKAIKAITARWSKHKAKQAAKTDTPSNTPVKLENYPTSEVQVQKQKQELPPTPSAARRGIEQPIELAGAIAGPDVLGAPAIPEGRRAAAPAAAAVTSKSEQNGKPPQKGPTALPNGKDDGYPHLNGKKRLAHRVSHLAGHLDVKVRPSKEDLREKVFKTEILTYWQQLNSGHPDLPWRAADDRALHALLSGDQGMTLDLFRRLLRNRARSEVNPSALPHKWLRNIMEYASGPVGKFGKPRSEGRSL